MKRIDQVYLAVKELCQAEDSASRQVIGVSTDEVAAKLGIQRSNASGDLNNLVKTGRLEKIEGKPVLYKLCSSEKIEASSAEHSALDDIIGVFGSLKTAVQQAKAAIMYPPLGLHTLLLGETGVGKSMFAEVMFRYAQDIGRLKANAPFITFNCADYAHNPQLLLAQLFGAKKGSYTGAERDRVGIVEKANRGILFLDEVHRLPPEGQEMLFYLIDRGVYRSLGEVEEYKKVQILIVCATTENTDSALLRTFVRRIPMIIKLPPIRERTIGERWELVKTFFKHEAQCLKIPVSATANSLKAFLLYDCPNNIGQLKSDIKLSCARAFLDYVANRENGLKVHSEDLPEHIRRGFVKYKEYREDIDKIGLTSDFVFYAEQENMSTRDNAEKISIYETLEEKMKTLQNKGLGEKDIQLIMSLDIEAYVKQYMSKFRKDNLEELYKIVDKKVVDVIQEFLQLATQITGRQFDDKILFGLSIHVASVLERVKSGKDIFNLHLAEIQKSYSLEFSVAGKLGVLLEERFGIQVPPDEIGFITMFLVLDEYIQKEGQGRVAVIIAMHGASTASSMADVANRLLGEKHAVGYDMPLDLKPDIALEEITKLVEKVNEGQGVLMLVDMGSLIMFGDMIYERTSIPIKTVEMVSTPMALEAVRKALMLTNLDEIYHSLTNISPYIGKMYWHNEEYNKKIKDDVIVTACITGRGTAIKLKNILQKILLEQGKTIDVLCVEIASMEEYNRKIATIKQEKNIVAIVSSIKPSDKAIHYISTQELIEGKFELAAASKTFIAPHGNSVIERLSFMQNVINEHLKVDGAKFMQAFSVFYEKLAERNLRITENTIIGLIMHLACVVERLMQGEALPTFESEIPLGEDIYNLNMEAVGDAFKPIEDSFQIKMPASECANVIKHIHFNSML